MDLTDSSAEFPDPDEPPPDFTDWTDPEELLEGVPIRERLLDVVVQVRTPTKVSTIAERAGCDTETAREYLRWFAEMGIVREHTGRPVRYERNDSYLWWRRVEKLREHNSEATIREALEEALGELDTFRDRYDAASAADVSLVAASRDRPVEDVWEDLARWETLERRVELLDAARRDSGSTQNDPRVDV